MSNSYYDGGYNKRGGGGGGGGRNSAGDASKIFVGGLNRDTTDDDMRNYFSKYGTVTECMVKKDPNTGTSRGFGFVTFADPSSVDLLAALPITIDSEHGLPLKYDTDNNILEAEKILEMQPNIVQSTTLNSSAVSWVVSDRSHILQGKTIDPKRVKARTGLEGITKVFVGGLDPNLPEQDIRDYFQRFGKIDTLELPYDREKNMRRGFCFVSFESSDAVDTLCASAKHTIGGREVDVKKATPKGEQRQDNQHGGRGGRNGGAPASDPYGAAGWGAQPGYPAAPAPYGAAYDYSAYYAQQAAYPGYGPPAAGGYADPYAQAYAATGAYDYSAWYGATPTAPAGQPAANGSVGSGGPYGRSQRGGASDNRYQPY